MAGEFSSGVGRLSKTGNSCYPGPHGGDNLKDQVCIVTGGGSGFGRAIAIKLAQMGTVPVLVGRTRSKLDGVRREIESAGARAIVEPCDLTDFAAVRRLAETVLDQQGRIDVLVNNAGSSSPNRTVLTTTPEEAEDVVRVNLLGPFFLTQAVLPSMLKAEKGTIVNVSSVAALSPSRLGGPIYSAAKAALVSFTHYLNVEMQNSGIRACSIIPGEADTPTIDGRPVPPSEEARTTMLTAEDVADAVVMAIAAPHRALVEEIIIRPRFQRDSSRELVPPF